MPKQIEALQLGADGFPESSFEMMRVRDSSTCTGVSPKKQVCHLITLIFKYSSHIHALLDTSVFVSCAPSIIIQMISSNSLSLSDYLHVWRVKGEFILLTSRVIGKLLPLCIVTAISSHATFSSINFSTVQT